MTTQACPGRSIQGFPVVRPRVLFHVGAMDATLHRAGYEGDALSVSVHPHAWMRIARLGGGDLWTLRRDGGALLDVHRVGERKRAAVVAEAAAAGLIEPRRLWRVFQTDEYGDVRYSEYDSEVEAREKADFFGDLDDGTPCIQAIDSWAALPELAAIVGRIADGLGSRAEEMALLWAAERVGIFGAWWDETLNPYELSAPRGGIFRSALSAYAVAQTDWDNWPDDFKCARAGFARQGWVVEEDDY